MKAFLLGILAALAIMGMVMYMASRMSGQGITVQATLTPMAYLPFIGRNYDPLVPTPTPIPAPTPVPLSAKKSLNTCCGGDLPTMFAELGADWYYAWSPNCGQIGMVEQYPMVRDAAQLTTLRNNPTMLDACPRPVLGFNEPENQDCAAGACMTLAELVASWHELEALLPEHLLVSPAFLMAWTQQGYNLIDFIDAYEVEYGVKPRLDMVAVHEYGSESLGDVLQAFTVTKNEYLATKAALAVRGYNVPIWVTEFGWWASEPLMWWSKMNAAYFLDKWITFCNSDSLCEYLNWFGLTQGTYWFVSPLYLDGELTFAGQTWKDWR